MLSGVLKKGMIDAAEASASPCAKRMSVAGVMSCPRVTDVVLVFGNAQAPLLALGKLDRDYTDKGLV